MAYSQLFTAAAISFILTLLALPIWIRLAKKHGFTGKDMHKPKLPEVAELGGIVVVPSIIVGILAFVAMNKSENLLLAAACSLLIAGIIGIVDDILGWKTGLKQSQKVMLSVLIALPIMAVNAGTTSMYVPFVGKVAFGIFYPLLIVPIGIIGAANAFNMLAGYNGLEAGMGIISVATLGFLALHVQSYSAAVIAACVVASLIAFIIYNRYPARIFPGNALTYTVGASLAIISIYANIEKYAIILFIPFLAEFLLKARGKFRRESYAKVNADGSLSNRAKKWYSLSHAVISASGIVNKRATEKRVVWSLLLIEALFAFIALLVFF